MCEQYESTTLEWNVYPEEMPVLSKRQPLVERPIGRLNSLAPGKFEWNIRYVNFKRILLTDGWGISCEIAVILLSLDFTDDKSTLVQVMAWCRQATSHYPSQCWLSSLSPDGVARPQWVKLWPQIFKVIVPKYEPQNMELTPSAIWGCHLIHTKTWSKHGLYQPANVWSSVCLQLDFRIISMYIVSLQINCYNCLSVLNCCCGLILSTVYDYDFCFLHLSENSVYFRTANVLFICKTDTKYNLYIIFSLSIGDVIWHQDDMMSW